MEKKLIREFLQARNEGTVVVVQGLGFVGAVTAVVCASVEQNHTVIGIDQDTSFGLLDHAIEKGINLLDKAESYGGGQTKALRERQLGIQDDREVTTEISSSENIIGRWLAQDGGRRDAVGYWGGPEREPEASDERPGPGHLQRREAHVRSRPP